MKEVYTVKVQKTTKRIGNTTTHTFTVSIPKRLAEKLGIDKGAILVVTTEEVDGDLAIVMKPLKKYAGKFITSQPLAPS